MAPRGDHSSKHHVLGWLHPSAAAPSITPRTDLPRGHRQFLSLSHPGTPAPPGGEGDAQNQCPGLPSEQRMTEERPRKGRAQRRGLAGKRQTHKQNEVNPLKLCSGVYQGQVGVGRTETKYAQIDNSHLFHQKGCPHLFNLKALFPTKWAAKGSENDAITHS